MKISRFIGELIKLRQQHGDIEVVAYINHLDAGNLEPIKGVFAGVDKKKTVTVIYQ